MALNLSPIGGVAAQFLDNSGNPLSGGKIYSYAAGTTTPQATYTSANGGTTHSNPIILDAAGRVPSGEIWLTDGLQYKFLIKTSADVQIGSYDNIIGINSNFVNYTSSQEIQTATAGQTVFTLTTMAYQPGANSLSVFVDGVNQYGPGALYAYQETSSTVVTFTSGLHVGASVKFTTTAINSSSATDAEQVGYIPPFTSSVATNVELKLAQTVSVKDFGAVGDGITDDTAAIQATINYAVLNGLEVYFPGALYRTTSELFIDRSFNSNDPTLGGRYGITLRGDGSAASMISSDHAGNCIRFLGGPGAGWHTGFVFSKIGLTQPNHSQLVGSKGLYLEQCAWGQIFDFDIAWFEYGIYGVDILTSNFSDGTIRLNEYGFKFQRATRSHPNNITFKGVTTFNNQTYGGWLVKPSGVSFLGGSIESNGYTGILADPNSGGLYVDQPGAEGSVGVNLNGVYIENNNGKADVYIVATGSTGATTTMNTFTGCTFLRFSNTRYVTNNILLEGANPSRLSISGCGFKNFAPYVADPSRIWIAAGDAQVFDGGGNVFSDSSGLATEISKSVFAPIASYHQLPYAALPSASLFPNGIQYCADGGGGTARPAIAVSDGTTWWQVVLGQFGGSVQSTGTAITLPRGWTVNRASAGVYVITHNLNITGTQYSVVATPIGVPGTGYCSGKSKSNNTFEVYFANTAGALTDMAFDFTLSVI